MFTDRFAPFLPGAAPKPQTPLRRRLAALALAVCCAGALAACKAADTPQTAPTAEPTAAPAADTKRPMPSEAEINAVCRADTYFWDEYLPTLHGYRFGGGIANSVDMTDTQKDSLYLVLAQKRQDGTTWQDFVDGGNGTAVKIYFDAELQPEEVYLGSQFGEGRFYVYIGVPFDENEPCELLDMWRQDATDLTLQFEILAAARALQLTNKQYRMLLHQCNALAQAGVRNFASPADWTQDERESYLYYRAPYFDNTTDALLILNVDCSNADDWNALPPYLTYDEVAALDGAAPKTAALPGYTAPDDIGSDDAGSWQFTREGDTVTAELPGVQRYTFAVHNDAIESLSRTVCTGGESLS